jgi:hypothetical protein
MTGQQTNIYMILELEVSDTKKYEHPTLETEVLIKKKGLGVNTQLIISFPTF